MPNPILYGFSKTDLEHVVKRVVLEIRKTETMEESVNSEDDRLTQKQAAKFLGISVTSLISWKKKGKVPYYQIGRSIFFSKSELLKLARQNPNLIKPTRQ